MSILKNKVQYIIIFLIPIFSFQAFAEENRENPETLKEEINAYSSSLQKPGILPRSPFYFLDRLGENVGISLARYPDKKTEKAIKYANEKIAELIVISTSEDDEDLFFVGDNVELYEKYIDVTIVQIGKTEELGIDIDEVSIDVAGKTMLFADVSYQIYDLLVLKEKISAATEVQGVIKKSLEGHEGAIVGVRSDSQKKKELLDESVLAQERYEEKFGEEL